MVLFWMMMAGVALAADGTTSGADPNEEPKPASLQIIKYDKEGTPYECLDYDPEEGCLYAVERYENGYMLYFVKPDGMRDRRWLPTEMVAYDPYARYTENPTHFVAPYCPSY